MIKLCLLIEGRLGVEEDINERVYNISVWQWNGEPGLLFGITLVPFALWQF